MRAVFFPRRLLLALLLLLGLLLVDSPASGDDQDTDDAARPRTAVTYTVTFTGIPDDDTGDLVRGVSQTLERREDFPPQSIYQLERLAADDVSRIVKALDSRGYFDASVAEKVEENATGDTNASVAFTIRAGERFRFGEAVAILPDDPAYADIRLPSPAEVGLHADTPYSADIILDAQAGFLDHLTRNGYPYSVVAERRVVADHASRLVSAEWRIDPGPRSLFGPTSITGLTEVDGDYARTFLPWQQGEVFDLSLLTTGRENLLQSGLFALARADIPPEPTGNGSLPVTVTVVERDHRTFSAGLEYTTDYGPGGTLGWEHRNLFGGGERLAFDLSVNRLLQQLKSSYRKPRFLDENQALLVSSEFAHEDTDAYESSRADQSISVERELTKHLTGGLGLGYRYSDITTVEPEETQTFNLFYVPGKLAWDNRDDVLDPSSGQDASLWIAPYQDISGEPTFLKYRVNGATYFELIGGKRLILALRGSFGQIRGASRDALPADLRFYAGGGGSVRGYAYQTAGPLDGDAPQGGASVLESSAELRLRITEKFGVVPFIDGGSAYESSEPDFSKTYFWGAGLGFRYYTDFGPLRLDVAFPLNRRPEVDKLFQVYVSIGQSF